MDISVSSVLSGSLKMYQCTKSSHKIAYMSIEGQQSTHFNQFLINQFLDCLLKSWPTDTDCNWSTAVFKECFNVCSMKNVTEDQLIYLWQLKSCPKMGQFRAGLFQKGCSKRSSLNAAPKGGRRKYKGTT